MTGDPHGVLAYDTESESILLQFQRAVPLTPRKVWRHLLDQARLQEWLTNEPGGVIERRLNGEVFLPTSTSGDIVSEVSVFDPEQTLAFPWTTLSFDGGDVQWSLAAKDGRTDLWFQHYLDRDLGLEHFARSLATWHIVLDRFQASLAGASISLDYGQWQQRYDEYEARIAEVLAKAFPSAAFDLSGLRAFGEE